MLNYYFGSKRGLFDAVFLRRAEVVNTQRLTSMNRYEASTAAISSLSFCTCQMPIRLPCNTYGSSADR